MSTRRFVGHKVVSYRLYRVANTVRRLAQGVKGVFTAGEYIMPEETDKAYVSLRIELERAQKWLDWAVKHLVWLEDIGKGEAEIDNPPKPPEGYLW